MSDWLYLGAFFLFAGLTVAAAVLTVAARNILHAAVALFFALGGVAALYVLLGADFLAAVQLLIYAGGILVLIVFGLFLTTRVYETRLEFSGKGLARGWGALVGAAVFGVLCRVIQKTDWPVREPSFQPTVRELGNLFLGKYLLPFELVSLLLVFAMVGAVLLVRKEWRGKP